MRINEIRIQNFKGFKELSETFDPNFTVFVGENGSGKTSMLEAVATALSSFARNFGHDSKFDPSSVRLEPSFKGSSLVFEECLPLSLALEGESNGRSFSSKFQFDGSSRTGLSGSADILTYLIGRDFQRPELTDENLTWPILLYYDVGRGRGAKPKLDWNRLFAEKPKRSDGYKKWRDSSDLVSGFISWIGRQEAITFQEKEEPKISRIVKSAVVSCLPNARDLQFSAKAAEPVVIWDDGTAVSFSNLSQGQKSILAMIGDIARRCATINPHLDDDSVSRTPGFVLIDELDLHLHPRWQRRIVDDLKRTFPEIQFITTTHSPFIIQALEPGELRILGGEGPKIEYANRGIEEIARFIQGVDMPATSERFTKQKEAAKTYFQMLREGRDESDPELLDAKSKLDRLTVSYADNPGLEAIIEMQEETANPSILVREE
jgi:predicted ATP-binding protein involved in virulence